MRSTLTNLIQLKSGNILLVLARTRLRICQSLYVGAPAIQRRRHKLFPVDTEYTEVEPNDTVEIEVLRFNKKKAKTKSGKICLFLFQLRGQQETLRRP